MWRVGMGVRVAVVEMGVGMGVRPGWGWNWGGWVGARGWIKTGVVVVGIRMGAERKAG